MVFCYQDIGFMAERLPDYMVPAAITLLSEFPLTPNGKVDRDLLRSLKLRSKRTSAYEAPRDAVEEKLCEIWSEVLDVDRIGIHDDFFDLGGHSLMATQLVSRIRITLQAEVPLRELFAHSTVAELAEYLATHGSRPGTPPLVRQVRDGDAPPSFAQQRLWFLDKIGAGAAYNISRVYRLTGRLHVDVLERTLAEIVRRHEALRTSFVEVDGQPTQRIAPVLDLELRRHDASHLEGEALEAEVLRLTRADAMRPFDLARDTLLRATLLQLDETAAVLQLTMHHIVSDGWSMGVLFSELTTLYEAFSRGEPSPLPELEFQYGDYAVWQRSWLQGDVLQKQLDYWCDQLADVPTLDLPTDRPRPAVQTHRGAPSPIEVPAAITNGLRELGRKTDSTLAMVLLSAGQALLSRHSGQTDIAIGSPIANRTHRELEPLIGLFVNAMVMRSDLSGDPTFAELVRRVQANSLAAYDHQDVPFERVVAELNPERDQSRHPLFQVLFAVQNVPPEALRLGELEIAPLSLGSRFTRFDLEFYLHEQDSGLVGSLVYNVDLFDASTIERLIQHYVRLLEAVIANPQTRLSELPLLSEHERQRVLVEWNDTAVAQPRDACLHQLFEQQVARTPSADALIDGETDPELRRAQRRRRLPGGAATTGGSRPRSPGRPVPVAQPAHRHRDPRRAESGRQLRAARSRVSTRAHRLHRRRRRRRRRRDAVGAGAATRWPGVERSSAVRRRR